MKKTLILTIAVLALAALPTLAQETPPATVAAYDSLAKVILDVRQAESDFIRALLAGHYHGAEILFKSGRYEDAAAEMALFANEGDNAIGGVRKRLIEGGHHHNAAGEAAGIYETGYVIVTIEGKQQMLAASKELRQAKNDAQRKAAWDEFNAIAKPFLE